MLQAKNQKNNINGPEKNANLIKNLTYTSMNESENLSLPIIRFDS